MSCDVGEVTESLENGADWTGISLRCKKKMKITGRDVRVDND